MSVRIILVDDHPLVRAGVRAVLEQDPELVLVAETGLGLDAIGLARDLQPDVVIVDLGLPDVSGMEVTRRIAASPPAPRLVVLAEQVDRGYVLAALEAGAIAYVSKLAATDELVCAVQEAAAGRRYLDPAAAEALAGVDAPSAVPAGRLTSREEQVLRLIATGSGTRAIGVLLHVSPKTVESHRRNIMRKLGLFTVAELTRYAVRHGLVSP